MIVNHSYVTFRKCCVDYDAVNHKAMHTMCASYLYTKFMASVCVSVVLTSPDTDNRHCHLPIWKDVISSCRHNSVESSQ